MPPPGGMAGIGVSFLGFSATIASGDQEGRDLRPILQGDANHLGRVDDSLGHEIAELASLGILEDLARRRRPHQH
jgi:hypothetical protein